MNNMQAINAFWSSFGVPAYEENSVDAEAPMPRITYDVKQDTFYGISCSMSASIWDRSYSWARIYGIMQSIKALLGEGLIISTDEGGLYIRPGSPYMQSIAGDNDDIRQELINIEVKYLEG